MKSCSEPLLSNVLPLDGKWFITQDIGLSGALHEMRYLTLLRTSASGVPVGTNFTLIFTGAVVPAGAVSFTQLLAGQANSHSPLSPGLGGLTATGMRLSQVMDVWNEIVAGDGRVARLIGDYQRGRRLRRRTLEGQRHVAQPGDFIQLH